MAAGSVSRARSVSAFLILSFNEESGMDTVTSASAPGARLGFTSMEEEVRVEDAPRVEAPHHIPFNFHQQYFPGEPHSVEAGA